MQKNLPYFLVIAALIFLIIGVLSSGKENPQSTILAESDLDLESKEIVVEDALSEAEQAPAGLPAGKIFNVYTDRSAPDNHYAPSGWMGDHGDVNINDQSMDNPHSGATCIQVSYSAQQAQGIGWGGIYWQNPPNNWGETKGGFDLTGYNKLSKIRALPSSDSVTDSSTSLGWPEMVI